MAQTSREWEMELEESAQGSDSYTAPGANVQVAEARETAKEFAGGSDLSAASNVSQSGRVEKARTRRHALGESLTALESAVASPSAAEGWLSGVSDCMSELRLAIEEHIETTEGRGGLLEEIVDLAPRLSNEVRLIEVDHQRILEALEEAEGAILGSTDPKAIRNRVMSLLPQLSLHRQRGADLVYEAYNVDIAAGD